MCKVGVAKCVVPVMGFGGQSVIKFALVSAAAEPANGHTEIFYKVGKAHRL